MGNIAGGLVTLAWKGNVPRDGIHIQIPAPGRGVGMVVTSSVPAGTRSSSRSATADVIDGSFPLSFRDVTPGGTISPNFGSSSIDMQPLSGAFFRWPADVQALTRDIWSLSSAFFRLPAEIHLLPGILFRKAMDIGAPPPDFFEKRQPLNRCLSLPGDVFPRK